jgi:hypothetical protein
LGGAGGMGEGHGAARYHHDDSVTREVLAGLSLRDRASSADVFRNTGGTCAFNGVDPIATTSPGSSDIRSGGGRTRRGGQAPQGGSPHSEYSWRERSHPHPRPGGGRGMPERASSVSPMGVPGNQAGRVKDYEGNRQNEGREGDDREPLLPYDLLPTRTRASPRAPPAAPLGRLRLLRTLSHRRV